MSSIINRLQADGSEKAIELGRSFKISRGICQGGGERVVVKYSTFRWIDRWIDR